jgi:hypothetical protein
MIEQGECDDYVGSVMIEREERRESDGWGECWLRCVFFCALLVQGVLSTVPNRYICSRSLVEGGV